MRKIDNDIFAIELKKIFKEINHIKSWYNDAVYFKEFTSESSKKAYTRSEHLSYIRARLKKVKSFITAYEQYYKGYSNPKFTTFMTKAQYDELVKDRRL